MKRLLVPDNSKTKIILNTDIPKYENILLVYHMSTRRTPVRKGHDLRFEILGVVFQKPGVGNQVCFSSTHTVKTLEYEINQGGATRVDVVIEHDPTPICIENGHHAALWVNRNHILMCVGFEIEVQKINLDVRVDIFRCILYTIFILLF